MPTGLASRTGSLIGSLAPRLPLGTAYNDPNEAILNATKRRLTTRSGVLSLSDPSNPYRMAVNQANRDVLGAQQATEPFEDAVLGARGNVLGVQDRQRGLVRGLLGQRMQDTRQTFQEESNVRNAANDVADLTAVANATLAQDADDEVNRLFGVAPELSIRVPRGTTGLPPGVRAALRTNADYLQDEYAGGQAARKMALAEAGYGVDLGELDVDEAQAGVSRAGLALAGAERGVAKAGTRSKLASLLLNEALGSANYEDDLAALEGDYAQLPPFAGAVKYTDEAGQTRWVTPGEADELRYLRQQQLEDQRFEGEQQQQLARLPRTIQIQQQRERAARDARLQESPFNGFDDTDFLSYLLEGQLYFSPWNSRPQEVLAFLTEKFGEQAARQKLNQLLAAVEKATGDSDGEYDEGG